MPQRPFPTPTAQCDEAREPEIPTTLKRLENSIDGLRNIVGELELHLDTVSRAEPPTDIANKPIAGVALCPLAQHLREMDDGVDQLRDRIEGMLRRLEI